MSYPQSIYTYPLDVHNFIQVINIICHLHTYNLLLNLILILISILLFFPITTKLRFFLVTYLPTTYLFMISSIAFFISYPTSCQTIISFPFFLPLRQFLLTIYIFLVSLYTQNYIMKSLHNSNNILNLCLRYLVYHTLIYHFNMYFP